MNDALNAEFVVSLKYSINFWRFLDLPLINCKIELDLTWSRNCMTSEISRTDALAANPHNPARAATDTTGATFQINSTKLYVPVVTLFLNDNIKFLENIKQEFKRRVS